MAKEESSTKSTSDQEKSLTRREKRKLAKEKKKRERNKEKRTSLVKNVLTALLIFGALGFLGYKVYEYFTAPLPEVATQPAEVSEEDWTLGSSEASAVLIEYGDYQCPACGAYHPIVNQLKDEYHEDLLFVYRHLPLVSIHPNAMAAAKAAEAAGVQNKYWEMHNLLYERQEDWSDDRNPAGIFASYAEEIELDRDEFMKDYESNSVQESIDADIASANALGLNSTPTFFLNGEMVQPSSLEEFRNLIDQVLQE